MKLAICPYCGKKIPYFRIFVIKSKCDYVCPKCHRESKVSVSPKLRLTLFIVLLISALIIVLNMIFGGPGNLWILGASCIPIIVLYLIIPFYIKLKPYIKYRDVVCERLRNMPKNSTKNKGAKVR